jgi:hypothetical protein
MIVESWGGEYEMRRSGQRDRCCSEGVHAKQATTVTGGRFAVAIRMLVRGTAIMMAVSCAVGMHMDAAVVIVGAGNAMLLRQAVSRNRAISEGQGQRRRDNTQAVDDGCNHRRPNTQSLGQPSQHVARAFALSPRLPPIYVTILAWTRQGNLLDWIFSGRCFSITHRSAHLEHRAQAGPDEAARMLRHGSEKAAGKSADGGW